MEVSGKAAAEKHNGLIEWIRPLFEVELGDVLLSHTPARAVPSELRGLTSVFGMGTGGTLSL